MAKELVAYFSATGTTERVAKKVAEPRIIDTFLEGYDFAGKAIVPFATSGGSGLGNAPQRMHQLAPGARVLGGRRLSAGASAGEIVGWVSGLGL